MSELGRVALFIGANQPLTMVQSALPELSEREILCRVEACTICGSDVSTFTGRRSEPTPCILGHEIVGRVVSIHDELHDISGRRIKSGDRIVWSVAASCDASDMCDRCQRGLPQKCRKLFKYGHQAGSPEQGVFSGGMAEYCRLVRGTQVCCLDDSSQKDSLPSELAAPASCSTATTFAAVRIAGELAGRRILILGAGALGQTAAAIASVRGASEIIVCDPDSKRRDSAIAMGATRTLNPEQCASLREQIDVAFEMSGSADAAEAAVESLDVGGVLVLVGSVSPSRKAEIDPEAVVRRLLRIEGVHNYAPGDLVDAIRFLTHDASPFPFHSLVEAEFSLQQANEAMQFAIAAKPIRVLIRP